jgi:hypothetical protein
MGGLPTGAIAMVRRVLQVLAWEFWRIRRPGQRLRVRLSCAWDIAHRVTAAYDPVKNLVVTSAGLSWK